MLAVTVAVGSLRGSDSKAAGGAATVDIVCPRAGPGPETQSHAAGRAAVTPFYGPGPGRLRLTGVSAGGPGRREAEGSGQSDRDQPARRRGRRLGAAAARDSPRFWQSAVG